jgi:hypothetical protein
MDVLIRYYLGREPDQDLEGMLRQYTEALWIEERQSIMMSNAIAKGMGGK